MQDARDGRSTPRSGKIFSRVAPSILPLLGAGLLAGLGIALGFLLLIVPGLYLITIWAVVAPVIVVEKPGVFAAFGRSRELVRGHGWTVFGIVLITGASLRDREQRCSRRRSRPCREFLEILIGSTIAQAVVAPFGAIAIAVTYFRLREAHGAAAATPVEA